MNIEDVTKSDILDALNIIKTVCYNNICDLCPFSGQGIVILKLAILRIGILRNIQYGGLLNDEYIPT